MTSVRPSPSTSVDEDAIHLPTLVITEPASTHVATSLGAKCNRTKPAPQLPIFTIHPAAGLGAAHDIDQTVSIQIHKLRALDAVLTQQVRS